ncbi:HIT family protein [Pedobacter sp. MW01-1-1]|uniref:HIT family protein n=1 Tax=Pedobacter sp. MW01-1-1 TaxID=3383027 RepID=UPI003FEF1ADF
MSIFSKIIAGEIKAHVVAENDQYLAFLDVFPLTPGHVLVIPKEEVDYIFDIEEDAYAGLWSFAKTVSKGVKEAFPCKKVGVSVIGLEVPHAHIHLIPMNQVSDMNFSKEKLKPSEEELADAAAKIRAALS